MPSNETKKKQPSRSDNRLNRATDAIALEARQPGCGYLAVAVAPTIMDAWSSPTTDGPFCDRGAIARVCSPPPNQLSRERTREQSSLCCLACTHQSAGVRAVERFIHGSGSGNRAARRMSVWDLRNTPRGCALAWRVSKGWCCIRSGCAAPARRWGACAWGA